MLKITNVPCRIGIIACTGCKIHINMLEHVYEYEHIHARIHRYIHPWMYAYTNAQLQCVDIICSMNVLMHAAFSLLLIYHVRSPLNLLLKRTNWTMPAVPPLEINQTFCDFNVYTAGRSGGLKSPCLKRKKESCRRMFW